MRYFLLLISLYLPFFAEGIALPAGWEAEFLQKVTTPQKKVIRYEGEVLLSRGKELKWHYRKPTRKEVCSDGKRVVVIDHDLEQASFYRMKREFDLAKILQKARHYKERLYTADYQGRIYTLQVDAEGRVDQIAYRDEMDNVVNIRFSKIRSDTRPIAPSRMRCVIPEGYDRIGG